MQNIICYLILGLALFLLGTKLTCVISENQVKIAILLFVGLIACTFLDSGFENVHRWITIGGFRLYISSIVLPSMIIGLGMLLRKDATVFPAIVVSVMLFILVLQPDASQLSAFAASTAFLICTQLKKHFLKYCMILVSAGFIIYSWIYIDALEAVPHVEDIFLLARNMGTLWLLLGIISFVLLLVSFLGFSKICTLARAVSLYYLIVLVTTIWGNFPVPLMGFGISPVIGYLLAIFLLFRENYSPVIPTHPSR
jgi:hypothetical protein